MFSGLGNQGTFWLFSGLTLAGAIIFIITIKETKGLTDDQIKHLFVPDDLKKQTEFRKSGAIAASTMTTNTSENQPLIASQNKEM